MNIDLSRRVAQAMIVGAATVAERHRLITAAVRARAFADLDDETQQLVEALEQRGGKLPPPDDDEELADEGEDFHFPGKHKQKNHGKSRGPRYDRSKPRMALVAATEPAEQPTGMIALLPAADHAARLAVAGGEPADELHATLCYLGEIGMFPEGTREALIRAVEMEAAAGMAFGAQGFAVSTFNPGPGGCIVLGLGGEQLEQCKAAVYASLLTMASGVLWQAPDQHPTYAPHITLIYDPEAATDPRDLYDRVGPVVFDRIRVAWGDDITDIPIGMSTPVDEPVDDMPVVDYDDDLAEVAALDATGLIPWSGIIAMEGVWTGDGRMWAPGSLSWDGVLPQALKWQPVEADGHDGSVVVGRVDEIWRDGAAIWARGVFDAQTHPDLYRQWQLQMLRTVSIKADSTDPGSIEEVPYEGDAPPAAMLAAIQTDQADDVELVEVHDAADPQAEGPVRYVFHRGRIRSVTLAPETAFAEAVVTLMEPAEVVEAEIAEPGVIIEPDAVVAAGYTITIPDLPPESWFTEPTQLPTVGAVHITAEGRIFGLIAPANVLHRGLSRLGQRVTARRGADYSGYMNKACLVTGDDGAPYRINAGNITFDCGHLSPYDDRRADPGYATQHYDNSCSIFARVRCGENEHGTWFSGALVRGVSADQVERAMGCALSGDWQGNRFNAALLVPVEGYPTAQVSSVRVQEGALVAACSPVSFLDTGRTLTSRERIEERAAALGHGQRDRLARMALRRDGLR